MSCDLNSEKKEKRLVEVLECFGSDGKYKKYIARDPITGEVLEEKEVEIVEGKEIEFTSDEPNNYRMKIPNNLKKVHTMDLCDSKTGEFVNSVDIAEELNVFGLSILVPKKDLNTWRSTIAPIENFNEENREKVKKSIEEQAPERALGISLDNVAQTIELILSQDRLPNSFFSNIDGRDEFSISRLIADMVYRLPNMLGNLELNQIGDTAYIIQGEDKDYKGNPIKLEHRIQASNLEEAKKIGQIIIRRLQGMLIKTWLGCWKMANEKGKQTFTCPLTEIMYHCNPGRNRKVYFNSAEKFEFYENIRSLENTKFVFTKSYKKRGVEKHETFEIRFLEIHRYSGEKDEIPSDITMTILNTTALQNEKRTFIGVGLKHKTLELHADDTSLATIIQIRKNQMMKAQVLKFDREFLIECAGLSKTNTSNKTRANKLLLSKLKRLNEKGVLLEAPLKIDEIVHLKIR